MKEMVESKSRLAYERGSLQVRVEFLTVLEKDIAIVTVSEYRNLI